MKRHSFLALIITFVFVASCSKHSTTDGGGEYRILGRFVCDTLAQDSVCADTLWAGFKADSILHLFIDKHTALASKEIEVRGDSFEYVGRTDGLDEVFVVNDAGQTIKLFASAGAQIEVNIDKTGRVQIAEEDSLNVRYQKIFEELDTLEEKSRKVVFDSICTQYKATMLPLLILRDKMHLVTDSVFLRQCLGILSATEKPTWLVNAIEQQFDRKDRLKKNVRLATLPKWRTDIDTVYFDFHEMRQNSALLYIWADFSQHSVDSLQMLKPMAKKYGLHEYLSSFKGKDRNDRPKRLDILTICLSAKDSASWREMIKDVPGMHVLLRDGLSNPNIKAWNISKVPYNIIIDRYSNVQDSYRWDKELQEAIERQPNNFSYQANGNKNNLSRTTGH